MFNFTSDIIYKCNRYSKALCKKSFKFVLDRVSSLIIIDLGFMLLPAEFDLIPEEWDFKKDTFVAFGLNGFKIVLALLTKVIIFYAQVFKV